MSAHELEGQFRAQSTGSPYLVYRDAAGAQQIAALDERASPLWNERASSSDISLDWDGEVSALHAQLRRAGDAWTLIDDGLSSDGTHVNGERLRGRRRLRDGDMPRLGQTVMLYRAPVCGDVFGTTFSDDELSAASLSDAERRVLIALRVGRRTDQAMNRPRSCGCVPRPGRADRHHRWAGPPWRCRA